jgi:hypothetical protein
MTLSHIHEGELANRYLAGTLSEGERDAYEPEVARNEDTLRELEATARLKVGLARLRESGELQELLRPAPWPRYRLAIAAAAAIAVIAVTVMFARFGGESTARPLLAASAISLVDRSGSALPVAATVALYRKRVATYDATIEASPTPRAIELRVLPEMPVSSGAYRVTLARMNGAAPAEPLASIPKLQPATDGFITLFVDASGLDAGTYQLDVFGDEPAGSVAAGTFRIRVEPPPP